ncbi:MAG: hypothetical protein QNK15_01710 [Cycloclasticus sp.]|nr:hypothetical protein [Cycloclasticus sp.]
MLTLSTRNQIFIGFVLILLMVATRGHHFATLEHLPGATWAVFFLAGFYLRSIWTLLGLLMLTWLVDYASFTWGSSSGFCLTRAYVFLLPAYAALWFSGHWYARQYHFNWSTLIPLVAAILVGSIVCELFSSGGFYFFSGRFVDTSFTEFSGRLIKYYPSYLQSLAFYIGITVVVHTLFTTALNTASPKKSTVI